uniref:Uncharacterized protein n=1 Tax=Arundo donax TaxID=35708 RepID=A0A0A8YQW4_ARUDO
MAWLGHVATFQIMTAPTASMPDSIGHWRLSRNRDIC